MLMISSLNYPHEQHCISQTALLNLNDMDTGLVPNFLLNALKALDVIYELCMATAVHKYM